METRSRKATTTAAATATAAAALGLTTKSTQPLRGRKEPSTSTAAEQTRNVKQKTAKVEEKTSKVKQKTKDTKKKIGSEKDLVAKARRELDALFKQNEQVAQELGEKGVKISVDEDGGVKEAVVPMLGCFESIYDEMGMDKKGMSRAGKNKKDQKTLHHTSEVATDMQQLTKSNLSEFDIRVMEYNAQIFGSDEIGFKGWKDTDEKTTNSEGREVRKNVA